MKLWQADARGKYIIWGKNPPVRRKITAAQLVSRGFSLYASLLFRFWKQLSLVPQGRDHVCFCLWQKSSKEETATAKYICLLAIVAFNSFFWLLVTAIGYASLLMRRVLTSEHGFQGKCSAGCGAQHRLAAWTGAEAFSLFGEWTSSITETSGLIFLCTVSDK